MPQDVPSIRQLRRTLTEAGRRFRKALEDDNDIEAFAAQYVQALTNYRVAVFAELYLKIGMQLPVAPRRVFGSVADSLGR